MQNAEIELKFPLSDPAALQDLLPQLGFHLDTPRTFESNILYDTPSRDLRAQKQLLRIRQYGEVHTLTHKRTAAPEDPEHPSRYKVRIETETTVSDPVALGLVFEQLGYQPVFTYEKYRTEWSAFDPATGSHPHLVIDETPIGNYAELEGPTSWIDRMLVELGIDVNTCLTDSYGKLFLDWKQRTASAAENLTFTEVAGSRVLEPVS
ncbi:MAG: class IV adenylate cyclase [Edaphobacter sp.]|uniref:class IV adenylate cyclase n=1 Tax=Edaphobacter sp. TaxID=1934404 RepID=UPI0023A069CB|nr:class IV adenylate cyclase [Edaphobacter sp.]MDE1176325.1 class IV adenylate cyclase [Edaphobacter sp.]